jgi:hypothetical protein
LTVFVRYVCFIAFFLVSACDRPVEQGSATAETRLPIGDPQISEASFEDPAVLQRAISQLSEENCGPTDRSVFVEALMASGKRTEPESRAICNDWVSKHRKAEPYIIEKYCGPAAETGFVADIAAARDLKEDEARALCRKTWNLHYKGIYKGLYGDLSMDSQTGTFHLAYTADADVELVRSMADPELLKAIEVFKTEPRR